MALPLGAGLGALGPWGLGALGPWSLRLQLPTARIIQSPRTLEALLEASDLPPAVPAVSLLEVTVT